MNKDSIVAELDELIKLYGTEKGGDFPINSPNKAREALVRFHSAIERYSPAASPHSRNARSIEGRSHDMKGYKDMEGRPAKMAAWEMLAVVRALREDIAQGKLDSWSAAIQLETCGDVLDQAEILQQKSQLVPAAVLAGGALETHLKHLCQRLNLAVRGDGSISKYDGAIAEFRNDGGTAPYDPTTGKQILAWGGIRNDAAHDPTTFAAKRQPSEVSAMISGIREFLDRVR